MIAEPNYRDQSSPDEGNELNTTPSERSSLEEDENESLAARKRGKKWTEKMGAGFGSSSTPVFFALTLCLTFFSQPRGFLEQGHLWFLRHPKKLKSIIQPTKQQMKYKIQVFSSLVPI